MAKTVLVVDDDAMVRACVAEILSEHGGFTVHTASDGAEALRLVEGGLAFDVLLTDRRMPGMGGDELVASLRSRGNRQFFIMMTGFVRDTDCVPGVDRLVRKPMRLDDLIEAVRDAEPHPA
ncbi:MAG: hypothetical protein RL272_1314 [Candidatus Parcubacteria bacterium]|jgi:CheY-like chemotaxis protein